MKILVISPKAAEDSAKRLAKELGADYINPYQTGRVSFREYRLVINYGFSTNIITNVNANVFNEPSSVRKCINKLSTLQVSLFLTMLKQLKRIGILSYATLNLKVVRTKVLSIGIVNQMSQSLLHICIQNTMSIVVSIVLLFFAVRL
jgi:hypothetical protein